MVYLSEILIDTRYCQMRIKAKITIIKITIKRDLDLNFTRFLIQKFQSELCQLLRLPITFENLDTNQP